MKPDKITLLTIALLCSLGGNIYAATYLLGHHAHKNVAVANIAHKQLESLLNTLPHDRQTIVRKSMSDDVEQIKTDIKTVKKDREQLGQLLAASTLDKNAINQQFEQLRQDTSNAQARLQQMTLVAFEQMTPDERQQALDHLNEQDKKKEKK